MLKEIIEICPHCEKEISLKWDTETHGFETVCPFCGKLLMLCSECQLVVCDDGEPRNCNWNEQRQSCMMRGTHMSEEPEKSRDKKTWYRISFSAKLDESDVRAMKNCFFDAMQEAMCISECSDFDMEEERA